MLDVWRGTRWPSSRFAREPQVQYRQHLQAGLERSSSPGQPLPATTTEREDRLTQQEAPSPGQGACVLSAALEHEPGLPLAAWNGGEIMHWRQRAWEEEVSTHHFPSPTSLASCSCLLPKATSHPFKEAERDIGSRLSLAFLRSGSTVPPYTRSTEM